MKKKILFVLTLLFAVLLLASCGGGSDPELYVVKFDSNGAKDYPNRTYEEGDLISNPPVPARDGYAFLGWYNGEVLWNFESDKVTSDITLIAKWNRLSYTVTFDSNGGSPVEAQTVNSGDKVILPIPSTKQGHAFVGWFDKDGEEWSFDNGRVVENMTLIARWEVADTYTLSFDSKGGTEVPPQYITEGKTATAPKAPTRENHSFLGWFINDTEWNFDIDTVTENITLTAKWQPIKTFSVAFDSKGGSSVATQHIAVGEKATRPPTPTGKPNSIFIGWFLGETEWNFDSAVNSDITLTAKWITRYTVTFDTNGAVETIPSFPIDEGNLIIKPQDPTKANSRFLGWYDGDKEWNFTTDKITRDITLTAKWEPIPTYTVTFESNGGTTVTPQHVLEDGYVIDPGSSKLNNRLDGWYYTDGNQDIKWDFARDTVTSDITLKAKWIETVDITFNLEGNITNITVDKGQAVPKPDAPKKEGYICVWMIEGTNTEWNFNTIATESVSLKAKYLIERTVTFDSDGGTAVAPITVGNGQKLTRPLTSKKQHRFEGWYIAGTSIKWNFSTDIVTEDIVLKAHWVPTLPMDPFT